MVENDHYDAIVIGSGIGGLTTASLLSQSPAPLSSFGEIFRISIYETCNRRRNTLDSRRDSARVYSGLPVMAFLTLYAGVVRKGCSPDYS